MEFDRLLVELRSAHRDMGTQRMVVLRNGDLSALDIVFYNRHSGRLFDVMI